MRTSPYSLPPEFVQNTLMRNKTRKSEIVKVSRLGCMRKSTVETDMTGKTVEHVEVWVEEASNTKRGSTPCEESSSNEHESK